MSQQSNESLPLNDLYSVGDLVAQHTNILTPTTLRWQLRHRSTNGLASACVRVGKKLLISKSRYEQWLATRTEAGREAA